MPHLLTNPVLHWNSPELDAGLDTFTRQLGCTQEEAKAALEWAVDDMKQYYDWNHQVAPEYRVGVKTCIKLQ